MSSKMNEKNSEARKNSAIDDLVVFRFHETKQKTKLVQEVSISKEALNAVPESFLSVLAQDRWLSEDVSKSAKIHVAVDDFPCKSEWQSNMAGWIKDLYLEHLNAVPTWTLPPGVELPHAMTVLDYFGLAPKHPKDFDCSSSSTACQIRAKLFLKYLNDMALAKQFCLDDLLTDPRPVKHYFFMHKDHDINYIRDHNEMGNIPIVAMGESNEDRNKFFEWVRNPRIRDVFLSAMEEEDGIQAQFLSSAYDFGCISSCCGTYGAQQLLEYRREFGHIVDVPSDMCFVNVGDPPSECEHMYVLEIKANFPEENLL